jgi:hydroxymethylpyrimidine pyrophosphatase-like HAD family hydrolase
MNLATMVERLQHEVREGPTLDAYLLAAGISQITDDYLHALAYPFGSAAGYLATLSAPSARIAAAATSAVLSSVRAVSSRRATTRFVLRWRRELSTLVTRLAQTQVGNLGQSPSHTSLARSAAVLANAFEQLPLGLRQAVVRLPACFHHFDQRPADVTSLAERFAAGVAARDRALLVVGVRTSGSYLAPLCAASLNALGYPRVRTLTVRPGDPLLRHERALVSSVGRERGLGLVLDDPPVTGSSVAAAAEQIERAGVPRRSIVLLLQTFGAPEPPPALEHYEAVLLPSSEWSVAHDLEPKAVGRVLSELLGPGVRELTVDPVPLPLKQPERSHVRGRFRVREAGDCADREVLVEGVGLGYLGAHRLAATELVGRFSPAVLGLRDGLLYREWIPDEQRVGAVAPGDEGAIAAAVATYVSDRSQALPLDEDLSLRMAGHPPAWEVASRILSQAFGRAWPLARVLLTDGAAKRLLRVRRPSVVDGNTDLAEWFRRNGSPSSLVKPDIGEDQYSNLCAPCFDAAFDLAGVTARADEPWLPRILRQAFAQRAGEVVDEERWLLYELVHLWGRERTQPQEATRLRGARARALQRYFADVYLRDLAGDPDGPLCALDIDGVLESEQFGFSGLTPAAAVGLRSLLLHGYQPVLASGRSLGEVSERCRIYGLAGGVAEYGAVTFQNAGDRVDVLVPDAAASALDRLRAALSRIDGIHLDPDYRFSIRAFTRSGGSRRAVPQRIAEQALAAAGETGIRAIVGDGQTDFVAQGVSKGPALRALAAALGAGGERPFALAVGDTAADLDLAELSPRPCAPRHADPVLRQAGFEVTSRPYQAGMAQAVSGLLGHPPGGCATCAMPAPPRERAILASLLGARERGGAGIVLSALQLGWLLR